MKIKQLISITLLFKISLLLGQTSIFSNYSNFEYLATYRDSVKKIYTIDTIQLIRTCTPWKYAPNKQKTIIWKYKIAPNSHLKSNTYSIGWLNVDSTGYIENDKKIFIHPPRNNQYSYTEIAPFPQIDYPLEVGKRYKKILFIGFGMGKWENLKLINQYEIIKKENIFIFGKKMVCWLINATSNSELGISKMNFIFSEEIGFIEMDYLFFDKKRIHFKLIGFREI